MRPDLKPTRSELRETKRRLEVVRKGHDLLKRKQQSLMAEFYRALAAYKDAARAAAQAGREARQAALIADMAIGQSGIWSYALTRAGRAGARNVTRHFMGVELPDFEFAPLATGVPDLLPADPPQCARAAVAATRFVQHLTSLAGVEARVRVLVLEIERAKRRVNALEMKLMPQLEVERDFIQSQLDEMERASLFALKRVRSKITSRGE